MKLLRVAYVLNVFPKLSETFIASELAELRRRGVALRILSLRRPSETLRHAFIREAGLEGFAHYDPELFPDILRQFRPQVLHAHFATEPALAARTWAAAHDIPFTFTAHGYDIRRRPPADFKERAAAARAVITVSHANARYITETFRIPPAHVRIIPCGVDTEQFCPPNPPRFSAVPNIVCVARHAPVKNLALLLDACAALKGQGVAFRCVLVGEGPCRADLEGRCRALGLADTVRFAGAAEHNAVLRWWQQAAVAVLTSESEGMPVCLMEAAACGVPAVATAVGGVPELVEDGRTGILAPPGDAAGIAFALRTLLEDDALRARMGAAARRRAETHFSLCRQVDDLLELWSEVTA